MPTVVEARHVSKQFVLVHNRSTSVKERFLALFHRGRRQTQEDFLALTDISLRIEAGETVGLVGRNGSGKSTLLKLIAGIYRPSSGRLFVTKNARIGTMIELGLAFHEELTGRENVSLNASVHGLTRREIEKIYREVVEYAGLDHFMDVPLKNYSSGMKMRLGFAVAAQLNPDILLLDEVFAVGDEDFQQRCVGTIHQFAQQGKTIIFVSHSAETVAQICSRVCVLEKGRLVYDGPTGDGLEEYHRLIAVHPDLASRPTDFVAVRPRRA